MKTVVIGITPILAVVAVAAVAISSDHSGAGKVLSKDDVIAQIAAPYDGITFEPDVTANPIGPPSDVWLGQAAYDGSSIAIWVYRSAGDRSADPLWRDGALRRNHAGYCNNVLIASSQAWLTNMIIDGLVRAGDCSAGAVGTAV